MCVCAVCVLCLLCVVCSVCVCVLCVCVCVCDAISSGVVVADQANLPSGDDALLPGDVIHSINNQAITSLAGLKGVLETLQLYDPVVVQVERRGELRYVAFELE